MFEYRAEILRVIDGDTVVVQIDLGFHISVVHTLRLYAINAPEKRGGTKEEKLKGWEATKHMEVLLQEHAPVIVKTIKDKTGKYGRILATLIGKDGTDLNQQMIKDGHAKPL